jgi:hypothetical protein
MKTKLCRPIIIDSIVEKETNLDTELKAYGISKKAWEEAKVIAEYHDKMMSKEPILYTEEEVKDLCNQAFVAGHSRGYSGYPNTNNWTKPEFNEWFETNKKK